MKSYTDIEQSHVLAGILPVESADMCYLKREINNTFIETPIIKPIGSVEKSLPCWSLSALLSVIPNYKLSSEHNYHTCTAETSFGKETVAWFDNPIDACYEMINKLHEQKLL